ncbi:hypothetical protein KFE25_007927 [Diacronema lutheri]|uniref:Exonuclease domain-containing protein n=1 Tax=Diacronema lutheri TaxID=2081491 RepID=A0A8J5XG90_DIALT|nr:hypothetical protein KFE25_007927 [Diacronema lutheri]
MVGRPGWGSLRPPTPRDIAPRRTHKGLDAPVPAFEYLVVLDFEWTADNRRRLEPVSEITQFPSVLVQLAGLSTRVLDEFDTFVRPRFNPALTRFSIELTGITQADVDGAPPLEDVLPRYVAWLCSHGLADADGRKCGLWAFCTWSDADVGTQLATEARVKGLALPPCFSSWVDLKAAYRSHFKVEAKGGLRACVERLGLAFDGRAHNGLVDSRNTAKIVVHMAAGRSYAHGAYVFRRPTRGLDASGRPYGSRARARSPPAASASATPAPGALLGEPVAPPQGASAAAGRGCQKRPRELDRVAIDAALAPQPER